MNKASLALITKELSATQQSAHNNNYNSLANKDMEIYNSIDGKIQDHLADSGVSDNMIGSRTAVDPFNESTNDGTLFTGEITGWLSRISSRIVGLAQSLNEYSQSSYSNVSTMQVTAFGNEVESDVSREGVYRQLDGIFLGTLTWDDEGGELRFPCVAHFMGGSCESTKYYFYLSKDFADIASVTARILWFDDVSCTMQSGAFPLVGEDFGGMFSGTLYLAQFEYNLGQPIVRVRCANENDFIEITV